MKIKLAIIFVITSLLFGCSGKSDKDYLKESINNKIDYINSNNITVYSNSELINKVGNINSFNLFNTVSEITLNDDYTFIGFNVEVSLPTTDDIEKVKQLLSQNDKLFNVCFFGTKDFNYLKPILENEKQETYENTKTIAFCFGNFGGANTQYMHNVMGQNFEDVVKNDMLYQDTMLIYTEKQIKKYYEFIG